jgi:putative ABC transport system permease protein
VNLFGELLVVFVLGWLGGILGGILVSKLLAMILLRLVDVSQTVGLLISPVAIGELTGYWGLVLLLLGVLNAWYVRGHGLLQFWTPNAAKKPLEAMSGRHVVGAVGGVGLLGLVVVFAQAPTVWTSRAAHAFGDVVGLLGVMIACLCAAVIGVYLLFACTLPVACDWLARRRWAQQASRYLPLISLQRRFRANRHSLWLTTALTTVTLTVIGGAAVLYQFGQTVVSQDIAQPIVATASGQSVVKQALATTPGVTTTQLNTKLVAGRVRLRLRSAHETVEKNLYQVVALSDYRRLRQTQPQLPDLHVRGRQAVMITAGERLYQMRGIGGWTNAGRVLRLPQTGTHFVLAAITNGFPLGSSGYFDRALVVSDRQYAQLAAPVVPIYGTRVRAGVPAKVEKQLIANTAMDYAQSDHATLSGHRAVRVVAKAPGQNDFGRDAISLRRPALHEMHVVFGFVLFVILLLGAVFMVATASILLLKQLVAARFEQADRITLRRLGMPQTVLTKVIYTQTMAVFALPLLVGGGGALILIQWLQGALDGSPGGVAFLVFGIYAAVYLVFAWLTAMRIDRQAQRQ